MKQEANFDFVRSKVVTFPTEYAGITWDFCFWLEGKSELVVMEVNHYGSIGSKPASIAREYAERSHHLKQQGIGFVWVTDGAAWKRMKNPLRAAFNAIDYMTNIKLVADGHLEFVLRKLLSN